MGGLVVAALLLAAAFVIAGPGMLSASAAQSFATPGCNSVANTPGLLVECDVDVANQLDVASGIGSSTVVTTVCLDAANVPAPTCTTDTQIFTDVINSVEQCNFVADGGGADVECNVTVTNTLTGDSSQSPTTVNQCIGTGEGGGAPLVCNPTSSTTGATVTQCNDSANGGTVVEVTCTVEPSTDASALRVVVAQCNNSANGGGSSLICRTAIQNIVVSDEDDDEGDTPGDGGTTPGEDDGDEGIPAGGDAVPGDTDGDGVPGDAAGGGTPGDTGGDGVPVGAEGGGVAGGVAGGGQGTPGTVDDLGQAGATPAPFAVTDDGSGTPFTGSESDAEVLADDLAVTGADSPPVVAIGSSALLLGALLILLTKRRGLRHSPRGLHRA